MSTEPAVYTAEPGDRFEDHVGVCPGCKARQPYGDGECSVTWHERGRRLRRLAQKAMWEATIYGFRLVAR